MPFNLSGGGVALAPVMFEPFVGGSSESDAGRLVGFVKVMGF